MKKLCKMLLICIGISLSIFTVIGVIFDIANRGNTVLSDWQFTKMAVGSLVIGVGFAVPSRIYESQRLPYGLQVLFHMGIGCTVMLFAAFFAGWLPREAGWKICLLTALGEVLSAFLIWLCFFLYNRKLAKRMNRKLREKEAE